jgi:hypothetical protein
LVVNGLVILVVDFKMPFLVAIIDLKTGDNFVEYYFQMVASVDWSFLAHFITNWKKKNFIVSFS